MAISYYIDEVQNRVDGVSNQTTTHRSSLPLALSYYHERMSKMVANTEFPSFCIGVRNSEGETIMPYYKYETAYAAPVEQAEAD